MEVDRRVPGFLGRLLDAAGAPVGTCFQVVPGVLVTAWHVLDDLGAGNVDAVVRVDPLRGGAPTQARVSRIDPVHDLAVLTVGEPLAECAPGLATSDDVELDTRVSIIGVSDVEDPGHSYRYLHASGEWRGGTTRDDQVPLGRLTTADVVPGMSGAPVRRRDGMVVGVVSARYNSADDWLRSTVWVARVENLAPLLAGLAPVTVAKRRRASATELILAIDHNRVRLSGSGVDVAAEHRGVSAALAEAVQNLAEARARLTTRRQQDTTVITPGSPPTPHAVGLLLAESFLPAPVADALAGVITRAESSWEPVRLGVVVGGELGALPWEALPVPGAGRPLALHPLVTVYRRHEAPPVPAAPGPLRILIAISAPLSDGGQVLDYERELRNVIAAVRGARQSRAQVRVVHFATTAEINTALRQEPVHVLHLSGHGLPGLLELEDDDGNARHVTADQFVAEAVPGGRMPPVIALAACHTDAAASGDPSFAARLIALGANVVIAAETAITDVYATRAFTRIYGALADDETLDVLGAVADARRRVQQELQGSSDEREQRLGALGEWAVLTVLSRSGAPLPLDPAATLTEAAPPPTSPRLPAGLLARQVGEFVGRRREQRRWPVELAGMGLAGLVLHGIGGVGKTTLSAELARRVMEREPDRLVVLASGGTGGGELPVDYVLGALAGAVRARLRDSASQDMQAALDDAERVDLGWRERLAGLRQHVLGDVPVLLVLDNFEDNLTDATTGGKLGWRAVRDEALAGLLAELARSPGRCRLLVTCRYPFTLPGGAERVLSFKHLGPLSFAETLKLAWALPGLDRLGEPELEQVWRMVGGHPRCLEYLDALLCGGRSTYPDVTARLAAKLHDRLDVNDLDAWFAEHSELDPALTEILTLAADDVLLDRLLVGLAEVPGAQRLLLGASVYRSAVDETALLFQIGEEDPAAAHTPDYPSTGQLPTPPRRAPDNLRRLIDTCAASSLLTLDASTGASMVFVHRWTAIELHRRWTDRDQHDQLTDAHLSAADYWQWRVQVWPQNRARGLDDLLEARYHLLAADQPAAAAALTEDICAQLHDWSSWDHEEALIHDTLTYLPASSDRLPAWLNQLGDIAADRGRLPEAAQRYQQALTIRESLVKIAESLVKLDPQNTSYQHGLSLSYNKLADLDQAAGRLPEAAHRYQQALTIRESLVKLDPQNTSYQRGLSISYNKLADLDQAAGRLPEAAHRYQQALTIAESLVKLDPQNTSYQHDLSISYGMLGGLDEAMGRPGAAIERYRQGLAITERLTKLNPEIVIYQQDLTIFYARLENLERAPRAGWLSRIRRRVWRR
ncbi:MAG: trypsin-like peptidase domain-containing protein [Pseudonocardiales bacterium]